MKSIFGFISVFILFLPASCTKGSNDMVYIRFENVSQKVIGDASIYYYFSAGKVVMTKLNFGSIQPGEITGYIGFKNLSCNASMPLVGLKGNVDGQSLELMGYCGVGTYTMKDGHYTAEITTTDFAIHAQLKQ